MKKILVPTDFSDYAYYAAEVAASIARKTGARIYLLHVIDIPTYMDDNMRNEYEDIPEGIYALKMTKKRFKEMIDQPFFEDVNVVEVLQFENVYETITQQAEKHGIDLIVMGSHGTSGFSEIFIGSNTEKAVRLAKCPVLTVKEKNENFEVKKMVYASDFDEEVDVYEKIRPFVELYDLKIHLVKVVTPDRFEKSTVSMDKIGLFVKKHNLKNFESHIFNAETVESGILEFSKLVNADLISMATHGRTGVAHLINGSLAEDIVNHADLPVLSVRLSP